MLRTLRSFTPLLVALVVCLGLAVPATAGAAGLAVGVKDRPDVLGSSKTASVSFTIRQGRAIATGVTVTCTLDGKLLKGKCASPKRITGLKDGKHTLVIAAKKKVGTRTLTGAAKIIWTIDTIAPTAPKLAGTNASWSASSVTVVASGSIERGSGIVRYESEISTNNGASWGLRVSGATRTVAAGGVTILRFRAVDKVGKTGAFAQTTVRIDEDTPVVPTVSGGSATWASIANRVISATSSDGRSGIARLEFQTSTDSGASWTAAAAGDSVALTGEGTTIVRFRAVDNVGRTSEFSTPDAAATARLDRTAPSIPVVSGGAATWTADSAVAFFGTGSTDAVVGLSGYEYRTSGDGVNWSAPVAGANVSITAEGTTFVQYRALDLVGNASAWTPLSGTAAGTARIDRTNPSNPSVAGGSLVWTNVVPVTIAGTASTDTLSTLSYQTRTSTDGGATFGTVIPGGTATISANGTTIAQFRAVDAAGNVSDWVPSIAGATNTAKIDTVIPVMPTTVTAGSAVWSNFLSKTFTASGGSDTSSAFTYEYRAWLSGAAIPTIGTPGASVSVTDEGETLVQFRTRDAANNLSAWTASEMVRLDRTNPTAPTVGGGNTAFANVASVPVTASASTDTLSNGVTYEYQISTDGGTTYGAATANSTATITAEGTTHVQFRSKDAAGNVSAWSTAVTAKIDRTNPTAPTVSGGSLSYLRQASATISASASTDALSTPTYEYQTSTNGGTTWSAATAGSSAVVTADGQTLVQFRSIDDALNTSAWTPAVADASNTVRLDNTAPTAPTVTGGVAGFANVASEVIGAAGSTETLNGPATYEYRTSTDGTTFGGATAGDSVTISAEGTTYVQFRSLDSVGNASAWSPASNGAANTVQLDRVDPTAPTTTGGSTTWKKAAVTIAASGSTDNGAGLTNYTFETSTDELVWTAPVAGASVTFSTEGVHYVRFQAHDGVNRASAYSATATAKLDLTLPSAPVVSGGSLSYANSPSRSIIAGGSSDAGGSTLLGYQFRETVNNGTPSAAIDGATDLVVREGKTVVEYRSIDVAGNFSAWTPVAPDATNTVLLDRSVPSDPLVTGGSDTYQGGPVTIQGSGSSDLYNGPVTYEYRTSTDGGATYGAAFPGASVSIAAAGITNVQFHAIDAIGNTTAWFPTTPNAASTVKIDNVAPSVPTVTGGSDAWRNAANTVFTASSTDALSNPVTYKVRTSTDGTTWGTEVAAPGGTATVNTEGTRYVQFQAIDASGNASAFGPAPVEAATTSRLDRSVPVAPTVTGGSTAWVDASSVAVSASGGSDAVSSVLRLEYRTKVNADAVSGATTGTTVSPADEGTTLVEFRSVDQAGNFSPWVGGADGTVKLDRTIPTAPTLTGTSAAWRAVKPATLVATGTDTLSGVAGYQISTDAGTTWSGTVANGSFDINAEGTTNALYRTVDNVGRLSSTTADTVNIDTVSPIAPTAIDGNTTWQKANKTLTVSGGDGTGSTLSYRYETSNDDGLSWSGTAGTGTSHTFTTDGKHRIRFYSVDQAGHESASYEGTAGSNAAYIDNAAPTGLVVTGGSVTYFNTSQSASAGSAVDALEGTENYFYAISTDGVNFGADVAGSSFTATTDGDYLVKFRVEDGLGNSTAFSTPVELHIDKTLPTVPNSLTGGNTTWDKLRTTATFVASGSTDANGGDSAVSYEYLLTTNTNAAATASPVVIAEGETTAQVRAKDRAGNYSAYFAGTSPGNTIRIDTVAPTLPTLSGGSITWQNTASRVITAAGSSDAGAVGVVTSNGVTYTSQVETNGTGFGGSVASSATRTVSAEGTTVVRFLAEDAAGNQSAFTTHVGSIENQVMIDTVSPTAPVVTGGSAGWIAGPTQTITASTLGTDVAPGSGVLRTEYETTVDLTGAAGWGGTTTGTSVAFSTTGERAVRFRTVDNATNVSAWAPVTPTAGSKSRLDVTVPVAPVVSGGSDNFQNAPSVTVTAAATTDVGSGVAGYTHQTSTDGGATWLPITPAVGSSVNVAAEGTTLVRFYAIDAVGNVSAPTATTPGSTVKIDRTAPTNPTATGGSYNWQKVASVNVAPAGSTDLNASNGSVGSGIESYEYRTSINGGSTFSGPTPLAVGSSVTISDEADTIVQFRATDNVGFTSAWSPSPPIAASTVRLDRTAPTAITISGGSVAFFDAASRTITASGSTGGLSGGVTYKHRTSLNGGAWSEGVGATVVVTDEGSTAVEFIAVDGALNETLWTSAGADGNVSLDRSAPTVPTLSDATGSTFLPQSASPVTVSALSTDVNGVGGITYQSQVSLNGAAFGDVQSGASRAISAEGVTVVQFRASDSLGHWSAWSSATGSPANTVALDKTAPTVPTIAGGSTFWRDDASVSVSLAVSTDTGGSGLSKREYQTTNNSVTSAWITYTAPFNVTAEGDTTIVSRAVDAAGNISATDTVHVKLDRLSPTDATVTGGNGGACGGIGSSVTITGSLSSDGVGSGISFYEYRVSTNGGAFGPATTGSSVTIPFLASTTYVVQFRATDFGGHASAWAPFGANNANTACFTI